MPRVICKLPVKQQGVIILTLILIVVITGSTFLFAALNNRTRTHIQDQSEVQYQMQQAKAALLAYAANADMNNGIGPGYLPCPDLDNDHQPDTDCDPSSENLGRLPEYALLSKTNLNGDPMRYYLSSYYANTDRQFWYAATPAFLNSSSQTATLNSGTASTLSVDGTSGYVAVIIAPNEAIDTQDRSSDYTNHANYLEGSNVSGPAFINSYSSNPQLFNDSVIGITKLELMTASTMAVARAMKDQLDCFHAHYSWMDGDYPKSKWGYTAQQWFNYAINSYTDATYCSSGAKAWLKSSGTGYEDWVSNTTYATVSGSNGDKANLKFSVSSCDITYTITYGGGITRTITGTGC